MSIEEDLFDLLCCRLECAVRYGSITKDDTIPSSIDDRNLLSSLYCYYRNNGYDQNESNILARRQVIKFILSQEIAD